MRWTQEQYNDYIAKRLPVVASMDSAKREPNPKSALEQNPEARERRKNDIRICVTLIACRHRLLDDDNSIAGFKGLRDEISRSFGLDDADVRIRFEYGQVRATASEGTIIQIERIQP